MFQNQEMANDPAVRTTALISLTCALMSLSYGCVYIIRFDTMRSMYKAVRWAQVRLTFSLVCNIEYIVSEKRKRKERQRLSCGTFGYSSRCLVYGLHGRSLVFIPLIPCPYSSAWNPHRSMIFFIISILTFVWRSGSTTDPATPSPLSPSAALGPRIFVSAFFLLGLVYFTAIVRTLQSYGQRRAHRAERDQGPRHPSAERDGNERGRARKREPLNGGSSGGGGGASSSGKDGNGRDTGDQQDDDDYNRQKDRTSPHMYDADGVHAGGLSAVMGLGLRGLDSFARPFVPSSQEEQTEEGSADGKH